MTLRALRIEPLRCNWPRLPSDNQYIGSRLQSFLRISAAATNHYFFVRVRNISSSVINRSSDGGTDGPGSGGPRGPPEEALGQGKDVSPGAEDKRMWRKWIEERLAHSSSAKEESNTSLGRSSQVGEPVKSSVGSTSATTKEYNASFSGGTQVEETVKPPFAPEDTSVRKRTISLDSIFKAGIKPSTADNAENSRTSNFKNPFRKENIKSSFFPERESNKSSSIGAKRGSFFQESAKQPSFRPVRQVPGKARQAPLDNLPVEALDEFEYRVLGSANEEDDPIDDAFLRDLDEIGRSARGIQVEDGDYLKADDDDDGDEEEDWGDEKAQGLSDLALMNSEEFDLEDEENPYRMRSDRLFFPGQTYDPEDLDLSKEADVEKPTVRTRKRYRSKEVYRIADFRNPRYLSNFIRESSRILPKRHFRISAKAQRKIAQEIKTARILGLMPFTSMGDPPFRFLRSRSDEDTTGRLDYY